jgi:hypothetical protein
MDQPQVQAQEQMGEQVQEKQLLVSVETMGHEQQFQLSD